MLIKLETRFSLKDHWRQWILLLVLVASFSTFVAEAVASPTWCAELFSRSSATKPKSTATTKEILNQLSIHAGKKYRRNPLEVEVGSLEIGRDYYVTPLVLRGYLNLSKKIKEPLQMRVIQISPASGKRTWKGRNIIYLESSETGRVAIESWRLSGDIFSEKDYSQHPPFQVGEYIQIGGDYSSSNVYKILATPEKTFTFSGSTATFIGKFVRIYDDDNYVVQIKSIYDKIPSTEIIVPRDLTYGLTSGTATHFKNAMQGLLSIPIHFKNGELIRFRKPDGMIALGAFVRSNEQYMTVKDGFNKTLYISPQSVFRHIGGEPHTAIYNADWIQAHFQKPSDLVRQFLDGAGKLTSLPDFAELSAEQKILTLMKYLKANVTWTKGATNGETAGLQNFNEILCAGAGVCRHLSVLMATMLSELGYTPRVIKYSEQNKVGHAWVEVDVRGTNGQIKTIIVDSSNGDFVKSFGEVSATASKNRNSFEALWYVNLGRELLVAPPQ